MKIIATALAASLLFAATIPAEAYVGLYRPGVGVGRPGVRGLGGVGGVGRPGVGVGLPGRPTPLRPWAGRRPL